MFAITTQFTQSAHVAVSRIGELLRAQVFIVDRQNTIVASSEPTQFGQPFSLDDGRTNYLQVPVQIDSQFGWAIVGEPTGEEVISPRLARVLVELVVQQSTVCDRLRLPSLYLKADLVNSAEPPLRFCLNRGYFARLPQKLAKAFCKCLRHCCKGTRHSSPPERGHGGGTLRVRQFLWGGTPQDRTGLTISAS